jgi:DNA-binding beta-propeller fold protein YncE
MQTSLYNVSRLVGALALGLVLTGCPDKPKTRTEGPALRTPQARAAYVTDNGSDTITIIDRDSAGGAPIETASMDVEAEAHEAPHHIALDAAKKRAFVALATHGQSARKGRLVSLELSRLSVERSADLDENPGEVVLTHDRSRVLVTHYDMKRAMDVAAQKGASPATMFATLMVFRASDLTLLGTRPICVAPHAVAVTKDDASALVACYGSDEIAVVDLRDNAFTVSRIPLGIQQGVPGVPTYGPYSITLSPDESRAVVGDLEGQDVRLFDPKKREFVAEATQQVGARAMMAAWVDATTILLPVQGPDGLLRIGMDPAHPTKEKRRSFDKAECALPHVVRIARDGRTYLVCEGDHTQKGSVLEIDPATLETKKRWTVGVYPDGIAFGDD